MLRNIFIILTMACGVLVIVAVVNLIGVAVGADFVSGETSYTPGLVMLFVSLIPGLICAWIATRLD